jgi:hypothetical protein
MNKKSAIALVMLFTLAIPMMASVQRQEMEHHHRKEMRHEHRPRVMHNKDFKMMCEVVDDASFHEKKIGVIKVACISSYFNSKQCAKLLSMIPFDDAKLKALKVLAPRMIGRDVTDIVKQFTFSYNKDKALELLRKAHQLKPSEF